MRKYNILFTIMALISLFWFGCKPDALTSNNTGAAPDSTQLTVTYTPVKDPFHYLVTATTPGTGLVRFDFGNKTTGYNGTNTDTAFYPLAGTYTITLSFFANGGTATKHISITQDTTDYAYFSSPVFTMLTGGINNVSGKNWQMDSLSANNLAVGPSWSDPKSWWGSTPLGKSGAGMYDDILNFKLSGLICTYINHGVSYVNAGFTNEPGFNNPTPVPVLGDDNVNYTPVPGTFMITTAGGVNTLTLSSGNASPIFPMYFAAPINNAYQIAYLDSNHMTLVWEEVGGGVFWQVMLIRQGYVQPRISGTLANVASGTGNLQSFTLKLANPSTSTLSISSATVNFGDGKDTVISSNLTGAAPSFTFKHRYMLAGTYTPAATITCTGGPLTLTGTSVTFASNDPSYTPPPQNLNATTVFNDFDSEEIFPMQSTNAGSGTATGDIVANPDNSLGPNRSANCYLFTKSGSQYGNNYMDLPSGSYFDLTQQNTFTYLVYGTAGNQITFKLQNTNLGGNAYTTATADKTYTIQNSNMWEQVTVSFAGWGNDAGSSDVTTDANYDKNYYNEMVWLIQPNDYGNYSYYIDRITGPVVLGSK